VASPLPRNSAAADVQFLLCPSIVLLLEYGEYVNSVEYQIFVSGTYRVIQEESALLWEMIV
jgi:hypothetical protein